MDLNAEMLLSAEMLLGAEMLLSVPGLTYSGFRKQSRKHLSINPDCGKPLDCEPARACENKKGDSSLIRGVEIGRNRPKMTEYRSKRLDCSSAPSRLRKRPKFCIIVGRNSEIRRLLRIPVSMYCEPVESYNRGTASLSGEKSVILLSDSGYNRGAVARFRKSVGLWPRAYTVTCEIERRPHIGSRCPAKRTEGVSSIGLPAC